MNYYIAAVTNETEGNEVLLTHVSVSELDGVHYFNLIKERKITFNERIVILESTPRFLLVLEQNQVMHLFDLHTFENIGLPFKIGGRVNYSPGMRLVESQYRLSIYYQNIKLIDKFSKRQLNVIHFYLGARNFQDP